MSDKTTIRPLAIAVGAAFAASLAGGAVAAADPFAQTEVPGGQLLAAAAEGKCGAKMAAEGQCGAKMSKGGAGYGPARYDADGDGKVTLEEFNAGHAEKFKMMDTDGDGVLSGDELACPGRRQGGGKPAEGAGE